VVRLIASREPRYGKAGRLVLPASEGAELAIEYPWADFRADIEEKSVDDPRLAATWGPRVYRITLAVRRPAAQGSAHLEISAAGRRRD